jgi:hypothetical protein
LSSEGLGGGALLRRQELHALSLDCRRDRREDRRAGAAADTGHDAPGLGISDPGEPADTAPSLSPEAQREAEDIISVIPRHKAQRR